MNSRTHGTIASIAISIAFGGMIGSQIFPEIFKIVFMSCYFGVIGLVTGMVISWDKAEKVTNDYHSYILYGGVSFLVLDVVLMSGARETFPPPFSPFMFATLFLLGTAQGLAYRFAALRALKKSTEIIKPKGPTK